MHVKAQFLLAVGLTTLVAACGKPAAEQPAPQLAGMNEPAVKTVSPAAPVAMPTDQTTPEQQAEQEAGAAAAGLPPTLQTRTSFTCDNDETVEVRFFPDQGIAVLARGGQNVELNQEPMASGFKYTNGQTTITGKGDEITMTVGMMAPTKCLASA
jgi:membrane-bound inhibitor of C-type lysozyme